MSPYLISFCILLYFGFLLLIAWYTSRNANQESYFLGNKASPWYAVAFGMIGDSLSGITFISVPGSVAGSSFSYMQLVFGYLVGYVVIANVLLPLYYKRNLTSIYSYLESRFGTVTQKTGSFFFIISRVLGAAGRLFLTAGVIQIFVFDKFGIPFWVSVSLIIVLMLTYTLKGGIKTLVWTDTFQSLFLLLGVILSIVAISNAMDLNFMGMVKTVKNSEYSQIFFWDYKLKSFFPKQFLAGAFIAIVMTGLDQNMMQKNLSMKSLPDAQKNLYWFSAVLVFVNLFFLSLGALLYAFATTKGIAIPSSSDNLFPLLALEHLGNFAGLVFIVGLTAATFSSADSVLTTLTTSLYIDFFNIDTNTKLNVKQKTNYRKLIHFGFSVLLLLVILLFEALNNDSLINTILLIAGYTYGPLLGLFAFGLYNKISIKDKFVPIVCIISPILTYLISINSYAWFNGYQIGNELLLINGFITYMGLLILKNDIRR